MARKRSRREETRDRLADRQQRQTQVTIHGLDDKISLILVGGVFLLHCLGLASLFSPLTGLFNINPLSSRTGAFIFIISNLWRRSGIRIELSGGTTPFLWPATRRIPFRI